MDESQGIGDLLSDREKIDQEIENRLSAHLMNLAEPYVPGGWTGFVFHLKTISG